MSGQPTAGNPGSGRTGAGKPGSSNAPDPGAVPMGDPILPCQPPKCWIEIEVLEEDGSPAAGEPYRIQLPDGEMREGEIGQTGMVRFDGIACGICKVWFPGTEEAAILRTTPARYIFDWIELELLEEDGSPCAEEPYWVRDPEGTIHEGKLDGKGYVRIDPIPSGICQVKFPDTAHDECEVRTRPRRKPPEDPAAPLGPWLASQPLDWIEIALLDGDGGPAAKEPYWMKLPDGTIREGELDAKGFARLDDIPTGTCLVKFPGVDGAESEAAALSRSSSPPASRAGPEAKTWIELELTEDDDVTPVADAAFRVTLPDGSLRTGSLDANGRARLEGIPPGKCLVQFPFQDEECAKV